MDEQHDPKPIYGKLDAELFHLARDSGLSRAEAEDVTQAVWLKFFERPPDFAGDRVREQARGWLLQVARNEIANAFRAQHRHPARSLATLPEEPIDPHGQKSASRTSYEHELFCRWLEELEQKDPLGHQLVCARHVDGVSTKDLAEAYRKDAHWIAVHLNRARNNFRAWLARHRGGDATSP